MDDWYSKYENKFKKKGYTLTIEKDGYLVASDQLRILGKSANTVWTAASVLCDEEYYFSAPSENFVVIDIGLNIGIAALYFAQMKAITHIYGYEPFLDSFKQAQLNLTNNSKLKRKISIYNVGLGKADTIKTLHFNSALPGSMSTYFDRFSDTGDLETIVLKNAAEVLKPIFEKHRERILLKIDCEGGEVDILPSLYDVGLLEKVAVIIMEWHFVKPDLYVKMLNELGFFVFNNHEQVDYQGIIRAINVKMI